jgi:hypothetical protein
MGAVADQVWAGGRRRRLRYLCRQGPFGLAAGNALPGTAGVELASRSRPTLPHPHPPQDIFRRYPNRYESIIATLCDNLESLDEPEAKASMIWIIGGGRGGQGGWGGLLRGTGTRGQCKRRPSARGSRWRRLACLPTAAVPGAVAPHACLTLCWRAGFWHGLQAALTVLSATPPRRRPVPPGEYAERIDNADELLESFLETFPEETAQVQLQLLTATVKLFLKKPTEVR